MLPPFVVPVLTSPHCHADFALNGIQAWHVNGLDTTKVRARAHGAAQHICVGAPAWLHAAWVRRPGCMLLLAHPRTRRASAWSRSACSQTSKPWMSSTARPPSCKMVRKLCSARMRAVMPLGTPSSLCSHGCTHASRALPVPPGKPSDSASASERAAEAASMQQVVERLEAKLGRKNVQVGCAGTPAPRVSVPAPCRRATQAVLASAVKAVGLPHHSATSRVAWCTSRGGGNERPPLCVARRWAKPG